MKQLYFFIAFCLGLTLNAQVTLIPDANFEQALINQNIDSDGTLNGQVFTADINTLTFLQINNANIADATGIEDFIALETLRLKDNVLTSIDVSNLTQLEILNLQQNNLTDLDLMYNQNIKFIVTQANPLNSLDVSHLSDLRSLYCGVSNISSIDLSNNPLLNTFNANNANLSFLNLKNGANTILTSFNAKNNANLTCIQVDNAAYSTSNWTNIDSQTEFSETDCSTTYIPDNNFEQALIDLGYDTVLDDYVYTDNINSISSLDISNKTIFSITGIEDFIALENLNVSNNFLGSATVNLSTLTALKTVNMANNSSFGLAPSSVVNVSGCIVLESFNASNCSIQTAIDLTPNVNLTEILINDNKFSSLNVKNGNNTTITNFNATNNPNLYCIVVDDATYANTNWTNIDNGTTFTETTTCNLTNVPDDGFEQALIDLGYDHTLDNYVATSSINTITSINLTAKSIVNTTGLQDFVALETLVLVENFLETIDLTALTSLKHLNLYQNDLKNLDLSHLTQLETVNVGFNSLITLNIKNNTNTNITSFNATLNPGLACVLVDNAAYSTTNWTTVDSGITFSQTNCNLTYIPNTNFEQALIDLGIVTNPVIDDYVLTSEIEDEEFLIIGGKSISNLTGIEDFTALKDLNLGNNNVSTLNLSSNLALQSLNCKGNPLASLNISQNTALNILKANETNLTSIDASNNSTLSSINVSDCPNLESLNLQNGNNANMSSGNFTANNNPNLNCIQVDDAVYSTTNWTTVDAHTFFSTGSCNVTYVPDDNFEQRLIDLGYDDVLNNYVVTSNISSLTSIDLRFQGIVDMTGIEGFSALVVLQCQVNNINNIDISNNTNLTTVYCDRNNIPTLDVSALNQLKILRAYNNNLTSLNVSNNTLLNNLNVTNNPISVLDVSANTQLTKFNASSTPLELLDLNANTALTEIEVNNNSSLNQFSIKNGNNTAVTTFSATGNTNLSCIEVDDVAYSTSNWTNIDAQATFNTNCHYGQTYVPDDAFEQWLITYNLDDVLDDYVLTSNINSLTAFGIANTTVSDLTGLEDFVALEELHITDNPNLTNINVSILPQLRELTLNDNQITAIDISNLLVLKEFRIKNNALTTLNVSNNTQLTSLQFSGNSNVSVIDLSTLSQLRFLTCSRTQIATLDLSNNPLLDYLSASETNITSIDFLDNPLLDQVYLRDNNIATLDFSNNPAMQFLFAENSHINTINLGNASLLEKLELQDNNLSVLDVSTAIALKELNVANNNLTALNVYNSEDLNLLNASNNSIVSLDVSNNKDGGLSEVIVNDNALEAFNIKGGDNQEVVVFNALNNPNLTCIQVDDTTYSTTNWTNIDAQTSFNEDCHFGLTYVPDNNFEQVLINLGYDDVLDDYVITNNINTVTTLNLFNKNISDATGIEDFESLVDLNFWINNLTTIDLSHNLLLEIVNLRQNSLTALDISANAQLKELRVSSGNNIGSIDVTNNLQLEELWISANSLTTIDVTNNLQLRELSIPNNQLTSIDVSNNTQLTFLDCENNSISNLNIANNTLLESLYVKENNLNSLELTNHTLLETLGASNNSIIHLDLSNNTALTNVTVNDNNLQTLNVKNGNNDPDLSIFNALNNPSLTCIQVDDENGSYLNFWQKDATASFSEDCNYYTYVPDDNFEQELINLGYDTVLDDYVFTSNINTLTQLILTAKNIADATGIEDFVALTDLRLRVNNLTSIDVSNLTQLKTLDLRQNNIATIDVSQNTLLETLSLSNNNISSLNLVNNATLKYLILRDNMFTSIDVSNLIHLVELSIGLNTITTLDVSNNPDLSVLDAETCGLSTLDLSANNNITEMYIKNNSLSTLTVTNMPSLVELEATNNNLTALDVSQNLLLEALYLSDNNISTLNVSLNGDLRNLEIENNNLTNLNIKNGNNTNFNSMYATGNSNLTCIQVDDENGAYLTATAGGGILRWQKDANTSFSNSCGNPIVLSPKVILQGAMLNSTDGFMRTDLRANIPLAEFTTSPYSDASNMGEDAYLATGNNSVVDWVWVELRDANDATIVVEGQSALLQKDGDVVSIDGVSPLSFNQSPANYYVVINHRNHLGIMTLNALALTDTVTPIDFTDANNQITYGTNAQTTFGVPTNTVAMWAGDVNGDGRLNYLGSFTESTAIRNQVMSDPNNTIFGAPPVATYASAGYHATDVDMDGYTKYLGSTTGINSDVLQVRNNTFNNPSNSIFGGPPSATYIFIQQLPEGVN